MKARGGFVTNSSSSNFVIFGNSKEEIIEMIKKNKMFTLITDNVLRLLKDQRPMKGRTLKEYYEDEILCMMEYARDRAKESLSKDSPFDWMYHGMSGLVSKEAGTIHGVYLERSVAFVIELDDLSRMEQYGWKATGFHYLEGETDLDKMVLIIGVNHH